MPCWRIGVALLRWHGSCPCWPSPTQVWRCCYSCPLACCCHATTCGVDATLKVRPGRSRSGGPLPLYAGIVVGRTRSPAAVGIGDGPPACERSLREPERPSGAVWGSFWHIAASGGWVAVLRDVRTHHVVLRWVSRRDRGGCPSLSSGSEPGWCGVERRWWSSASAVQCAVQAQRSKRMRCCCCLEISALEKI